MGSRPTVLASVIVALALLGDSLLYAVLPLHASTFGVSLAWIGVLLSANRIVRLFVYPLLARVVTAVGLRPFTISVAAVGACSTLAFAVGTGRWELLAARVAWGIAFGGLSLAALAYATASSDHAGTRVGASLSLRELGPMVSLTAGVLLVAASGVRATLAILGAASAIAIPLAMLLPEHRVERPEVHTGHTDASHRSKREALCSVIGLIADGIFPATIALLLAPSAGIGGAVAGAGTFLMLKRAAVIVLSPISGRAVEVFGEGATTLTGTLAIGAGALTIASNSVVAGAVLIICGAAVTGASIPVAATRFDAPARMRVLARLALARDAGAAAGPLLAMLVLEFTGAAFVYLIATLVLFGTVLAGRRDASRQI